MFGMFKKKSHPESLAAYASDVEDNRLQISNEESWERARQRLPLNKLREQFGDPEIEMLQELAYADMVINELDKLGLHVYVRKSLPLKMWSGAIAAGYAQDLEPSVVARALLDAAKGKQIAPLGEEAADEDVAEDGLEHSDGPSMFQLKCMNMEQPIDDFPKALMHATEAEMDKLFDTTLARDMEMHAQQVRGEIPPGPNKNRQMASFTMDMIKMERRRRAGLPMGHPENLEDE